MGVPTRSNPGGPARGSLRAAALGAVLAAPALAAPPQPAAAPTVLHLSQTAERRLPRDLLHVELRAEKAASSPEAVEAAINRNMAEALAQARRVGGITIETGSYAVYRAMPPHGAPEWNGAQALRLSGPDFAALLKLAGALQAKGLVMGSLAYEASPEAVRGAEDGLTAQALAALSRRAAAIARQLHLSVLGYRDLTVGNAEAQGGPVPHFAAMAAAAMPAPVGVPGEANIRVTVGAEILLAPAR